VHTFALPILCATMRSYASGKQGLRFSWFMDVRRRDHGV
jgi:hypothetical protein